MQSSKAGGRQIRKTVKMMQGVQKTDQLSALVHAQLFSYTYLSFLFLGSIILSLAHLFCFMMQVLTKSHLFHIVGSSF